MLEKVRALLAKADGTEFEGEAAVFHAKADELMTEYAIMEWELAKPGNQSRKPVQRDLDLSWYRGEFGSNMWALLTVVLDHCRVRVAFKSYNGSTIKVVGLETDLDYADLLFTSLMLELVKRIKPKPSHDLSYEDNLVMLKESGLGWQEITCAMYDAGLLPFASELEAEVLKRSSEVTNSRVHRIVRSDVKWYGPRVAHVYRRYCKKINHPQNYANYMTYRKNFAEGFNARINQRLRDMRREQNVDNGSDNHAALVLRDIRVTVQDALYEMFPSENPWVAFLGRVGQKPEKYKRQAGKIDYAAVRAGSQAADQARLNVNPQHGLRKREQIER
jgi:hypothetical protein